MLKKTIILTLFILTLALATPFTTQASPQSDYDFQLTQYRKHNAEFITLKQDYQQNPTLDNEQKALLAAKQAIISRDTAKIAYLEIILDSIRSQQLTQTFIKQTEQGLENSKKFYQDQIILAKNISSQTELSDFTNNYLQAQITHQNQLVTAQAARKLAKLIKMQINLKNAYNDLLPRLTNQSLAPVSTGIAQTTQLADNINKQLSANINSILQSEISFSNRNNFFNKQTQSLSQIKDLQIKLVNTLIDLDQNYAK